MVGGLVLTVVRDGDRVEVGLRGMYSRKMIRKKEYEGRDRDVSVY